MREVLRLDQPLGAEALARIAGVIVMLKVAANQISTYHGSFEEDVFTCVHLGIRAMGVLRHKLEDYGVERAIELLREHKIRVTSLSWAGGFTGVDGRTHEDSVEDGLACVRLAGQLGAPFLTVFTGGRGVLTTSHARRLARVGCDKLNALASKLRVTLALETIPHSVGRKSTFLTDLAEAVRFLDEANSAHPPIRLVFDTYHLLHSSFSPETIEPYLPRIGLVRVGDRSGEPTFGQERAIPGHGDLALGPFLTWLNEQGFSGPVEIHAFGETIEDLGYESTLRESLQFIHKRCAPDR